MSSLYAHPIPDAIKDTDWRVFHHLAELSAAGSPIWDQLTVLRRHLNADILTISGPDEPLPNAARQVIVPLTYGERYLGQVCLALSPGASSEEMAARLAFFAPVFALALAGEQTPEMTETQEMRLYQATQEERDRLEAVLEATNDAILMIGTDGLLVTATLQFEAFFSIPRYEVLGCNINVLAEQIEAQPGLPAGMADMLRVLADNHTESVGGEFEVTEPKRRVLAWYSLPVHSQAGLLLGRMFAFRDATRERELDRMKTEFVTLVSHELRTPLTSVKGFSDLILEGDFESLEDDVREYLRIIALNADRLIALINDILDITRIESDRIELHPTRCPMQDVIEQVAVCLQPLLDEHQHRLVMEIEPQLPASWADHSRMVQVVSNLLSNAIKYTLQPGVITVQASYIEAASDLPSGAPHDVILPCVLIGVQDTGLGISEEDQGYLFQRFYRAKDVEVRMVGGTGLGLMIVKSFVEMHGGKVWLKSALGEGSTFWFTVPVVEGKNPPRDKDAGV